MKPPLNTNKNYNDWYSNNEHTREGLGLFGSKLHWLPGVSIVSGVQQQCFHQSKHTSILKLLITNAVPISRWACQLTSQLFESLVADAVLIDERWRLLMLSLGWINSEPHCNRGLGRYCSYLRGIWHLKHTIKHDAYLMMLNEGIRILSPKIVPSPVTLFHFLSLLSLPSSSSLPSPTRGTELPISSPSLTWKY